MPKIDKNGQEYIEQDGKRYYRDFFGNWTAETDIFGNEKVDRDIFGNPKIDTDIFGNQKIETDFFGNPYVEPEKKDDSGCYLTTACMRAKLDQFDDNCEELSTLRKFRDTYVKVYHPEAIQEYYSKAPDIVAVIERRADSQKIYLKLYKDLVIGTMKLIKQKRYEDAFNLYRDYGVSLYDKYCAV
ncbi:MAG: hypothetical protein NC489_40530 [Ruminococcus flavefaciens]|nr:hypothetical protein [Ruminococcus flavefaciens]